MRSPSQPRDLILASSSPYRRELLQRLRIPFEVATPDIDESPQPGETPETLVTRLAREKAAVVASRHPAAVIIGSDQVAVHQGRIVGKPGSAARACRQLREFSGDSVAFLSAVCLRCEETGWLREATVVTDVTFRTLTGAEIRRYVELDQPLDCAGGFRSEAAGTMLLRALRSSDPTAIVGLPLIAVSEALREVGYALP